jgi:ATP-dependent DNA ligase
MLARLTREVPTDKAYVYEPKWDGFRCLAFRDGDHVDLRSRHDRPFARYFPEIVAALHAVECAWFAVDGELVVVRSGRFDFESLQNRLHPAASRVRLLAEQAPCRYIVFDLLAAGDEDCRSLPFGERRARLRALLAGAPPPIALTPATLDPAEARQWLAPRPEGGIDGVVAKDPASTYQSGRRAITKVKLEHTADCVVGGFRVYAGTDEVASLLLGLYDQGNRLRHVGVVSSFPRARRVALHAALQPYLTSLAGHPWEQGFGIEGGPVGRLKGAAGRWTPDLTQD